MKALLDLLLSLFSSKKPSQAPKVEPPKEEAAKEPKPIDFKEDSQRLKDELETLKDKNWDLYQLLAELNLYTNEQFDKSIMLTMIYRTDEEQDEIYKDSEKYKARKFKSPHQFWQAADIRSKTFTDEEVKQIEDYLNEKWNSSNYYKWTARNHTVGLGMHFHIQFVKP